MSPHLYKFRWFSIISRNHLCICYMISKLLNNPNQRTYLVASLTSSGSVSYRNYVPLLCPGAANNFSFSTKFFSSSPRVYNYVPKAITSSRSYRYFSNLLKNYLFDIFYLYSLTFTIFSSLYQYSCIIFLINVLVSVLFVQVLFRYIRLSLSKLLIYIYIIFFNL